MEQLHNRFYPKGTAITTKDYYGVHINNSRYEHAAAVVGGYGQLVEKPADLKAAIEAALACDRGGQACDPQCDDAGCRCSAKLTRVTATTLAATATCG